MMKDWFLPPLDVFLLFIHCCFHGNLFPEPSQDITDTASLQTAVSSFCSTPTSAEGNYGAIGSWITTGVTSLEGLFAGTAGTYRNGYYDGSGYRPGHCSSYSTFNGNIGGWDVSNVVNMLGSKWSVCESVTGSVWVVPSTKWGAVWDCGIGG